MKIISRTPLIAIERALRADGFDVPVGDALSTPRAIKRAALNGALLWTSERVTTTDASRIDLRLRRDLWGARGLSEVR